MYFNDFNFYSLEKEKWLQDLLKEKLNPNEVFQKQGYTIDNVIEYFIQNERNGVLEFLGSPSKKFCFRLCYPNEKVLEPHIIGDVKYFRTFMKESIPFMFIKNNIEKINVYTHLPSIAKIVTRVGFKDEGTISDTYLYNNKLTDIYVLGLKKEDYLKGIK